MSVKTVAGTLLGFLNHHASDLGAVDTALSSILAALPINAQTRETIQEAIDRVKDSAVNIEKAVEAFAETPMKTVTIKRSDIEDVLDDLLPAAVAAYMAKNPVKAPAAPAAMPDNAALNKTGAATEGPKTGEKPTVEPGAFRKKTCPAKVGWLTGAAARILSILTPAGSG